MSYLVTGGTGFIGANVARYLVKKGKKVILYDLNPNFSAISDLADKVEIIRGDILDPWHLLHTIQEESVEKAIHLAYYLTVSSDNDPLKAVQVNCEGFNVILEAARLAKIERIAWASSREVYGLPSFYSADIVDEDVPLNPLTVYGACKAFNEFMAKHYYAKWGIESIGFRIGLAFGPERYYESIFFDQRVIEEPAKGKPVTVYSDGTPMDLTYVKNIAHAFYLALEKPMPKDIIFNLGGDALDMNQIAHIIQEILPSARIKVKRRESSYEKRVQLDWNRIKQELGYYPPFSFEEAAKDYLEWAKNKTK